MQIAANKDRTILIKRSEGMKINWKNVKFDWLSGFFAGIAIVHAVPFFIRHDLYIAGVRLTESDALVTTLLMAILSITFYKIKRRLGPGPEIKVKEPRTDR